MASSPIPQAELDALLLDKPLLIGGNRLESVILKSGSINWHETPGSINRDLTDAPPKRALDGFHNVLTFPDVAANPGRTEWFLDIDLNDTPEIDCAAILGHNFKDEGVTLVELSHTNASYTTPTLVESIASFPDNRRIVFLDFGGDRFTEDFWTLHIEGPANFEPAIGELVLGRRRQMFAHPTLPHDIGRNRTRRDLRQTEGGVIGVYNFGIGQHLQTFAYRIASTDTVDQLIAWREDTTFGSRPSLVLPRPNTDKQNAYVMWMDPDDFTFPFLGPSERLIRMDLIESAPFVNLEA